MDSIANPAPGANRITGVGVLDRSVLLLELLADGPRSLRWLSEHSRLPRPTAHRLLVALEAHGLVGRDATGAFRLGPRLTELAFRADPAMDLATLASPVLARLHDATGESVQLYVRSGDKRLCIAARDAGTGLRDTVPVGALLPLAAGSGGKVLLAWAPDAARFTAPAGDGVPADELAAIRECGWSASVAEREAGRRQRERARAASRRHRGGRHVRLRAGEPARPGTRPTAQPGRDRRRRRTGRGPDRPLTTRSSLLAPRPSASGQPGWKHGCWVSPLPSQGVISCAYA